LVLHKSSFFNLKAKIKKKEQLLAKLKALNLYFLQTEQSNDFFAGARHFK
jgi:hypothetical protein